VTLGSPKYVRVETSREAFAKTMNEMRVWLDAHKIQPADFKIVPTEGGIAVDLQFPDEYHASLFQQKFA
jgi:hypothetical protein